MARVGFLCGDKGGGKDAGSSVNDATSAASVAIFCFFCLMTWDVPFNAGLIGLGVDSLALALATAAASVLATLLDA